MISAFAPVLLTLALPAPQAARRVNQLFPEWNARAIAWPDSVPSLAKGRMVVGDVTGDQLPDAVLMNGGQPVVVYGPAIYEAVFEIELPTNDIALLPAGAERAADTLVLVGPEGLLLLSDYDEGDFIQRPIGSSVWDGATGVRAADMNNDGLADLVGLSSTNELLFLENLEDPVPLETVLPIGESVYDFVPIDWEGDGTSERSVAWIGPSGLFVHEKDGDQVYGIPGTLAGGLLATFRQANKSHERLALVYGAPAQFLLVTDKEPALEGNEVELLPLGAPGVFGLAVADADLDRNQDLYVLHQFSHDSVLFLNQSGRPSAQSTFGFGLKKGELVDVAPDLAPPLAWSAWPGMADFSLDGDADALVFVEATGEFLLFENARRTLAREQVEVEGGFYIFDEALELGELRLNMQVTNPFSFLPTHVEIVGWKQTDAAGGNIECDPVAVTHTFADIDVLHTAQSQVFLTELDLSTPNIYHFDIRAVRLEGASVVEAGPSAVHAFTTPDFMVADLEAQFGEGVALRVIVIEDGNEIELTDADLIERLLAPKQIKTDKIPLITFPPNPFD